jgi:hypothetical protein
MSPKANRRCKTCFPPFLYRNRNAIESMFSRLKDYQQIACAMIVSPEASSQPYVSSIRHASDPNENVRSAPQKAQA